MNKDEIMKMPAGRTMDSLIAKHVIKVESPHDVYFFSTKIEDAWEVVEKMPTGFELRLHQHKMMRGYWQAEFHVPGTETFMVNAETAPLAICRAALLAVMDGNQ